MEQLNVSFRRYEEGDDEYDDLSEKVFNAGTSFWCPTYVNKTAPCQAECPSGHDIRTWLNVVARRVKPTSDLSWQAYAFQVMTAANPFPALMGLTCPAPCQEKCNREDVEGHVAINAIEHTVGDWALKNSAALVKPESESGKSAAIIGGGPAGLSCAYQLRRLGHRVTIFEANELLGGVFEYGFSEKDCPKDVVRAEIQRILDMGGIEVRTSVQVGKDVALEELDKTFNAVFWSAEPGPRDREGHFTSQAAAHPGLPTTEIGQGWKAARAMDAHMRGEPAPDKPKLDVHHYDLAAELAARGMAPETYTVGGARGTDKAAFSIHNYEDRSRDSIITSKELFLGHFKETPRIERSRNADGVLEPLSETDAIKESRRCMSCGMCFECSVCIQYCPVDAIYRPKSAARVYGRFVDTDYAKCIGCQICRDVCPTGYIQMGLERT